MVNNNFKLDGLKRTDFHPHPKKGEGGGGVVFQKML